MRAARYFGATAHTCTYCKNRRFHTAQEHTREFTAHIMAHRAARRRRLPGAQDFDGSCYLCVRGDAHTDGEHDRNIQSNLDYEGMEAAYEPHDGYPY